MSKAVEAYKCDWCSRCFGRKCDVNRHEEACRNNPERHYCITCVHGVLDTSYKDTNFLDTPLESQPKYGPFCDYYGEYIHEKPYYIDCETNNTDGWGPEYNIPGTCENYEYKGKAGWTVINNEVKGVKE